MRIWKMFIEATGLIDLLVRKAGKKTISVIEEDLRVIENLQRSTSLSVYEIHALLCNRSTTGGSEELLCAVEDLDAALKDEILGADMSKEEYFAFLLEMLRRDSTHIHVVAL